MKEYVIEVNIPKQITTENMEEFSKSLKQFIDNHITHELCYFEVFDTMVDRNNELKYLAERFITTDLRNCITGSRIIDYDFTPEIQSFFVKVIVPDDAEFYSKGKFIPRILTNDNGCKIRVCGLDYVKKTR